MKCKFKLAIVSTYGSNITVEYDAYSYQDFLSAMVREDFLSKSILGWLVGLKDARLDVKYQFRHNNVVSTLVKEKI